jgi:hypothetical protein
MRKSIVILLFSLIFICGNLLGDNKSLLEKILFKNEGNFSRITLFFDKQVNFISHKNNESIEIKFTDVEFTKIFPGTEFKVKSAYFSYLNFVKGNDSNIILKIKINNSIDYNCYFLKDSKILIVDIFDPGKLNDNESRFRRGLKSESEGKYEIALKEYRKLISENYSNNELYFHAGIIRESLGYTYQAKANLITARENGNLFPDISFRLSELYNKLNLKDISSKELKNFNEKFSNLKKSKYDTSIAVVINPQKPILYPDSLLISQSNLVDSNHSYLIQAGNEKKGTQSKSLESKIVKMEPIKNDSYYFELIANIVVVLVAIICVLSIWLFVKRGSRKKKEKIKFSKAKTLTSKNKKSPLIEKQNFNGLNLLKNEVNTYSQPKKVFFDDYLLEYKKNDLSTTAKAQDEKSTPSIDPPAESMKTIELVSENKEIERLAKKYKVEQEKIELALKLISKNTTDSTKEKYQMLIDMLKQNISIDELARNLRIPRGEVDLITNLNQI